MDGLETLISPLTTPINVLSFDTILAKETAQFLGPLTSPHPSSVNTPSTTKGSSSSEDNLNTPVTTNSEISSFFGGFVSSLSATISDTETKTGEAEKLVFMIANNILALIRQDCEEFYVFSTRVAYVWRHLLPISPVLNFYEDSLH